MTTIKAYTDLEQSRKLAEILSLETADVYYPTEGTSPKFGVALSISNNIPCWSLASLLSVLPKIGSEEPMIQKLYYANTPTERYICQYSLTNITGEYDNPVDACVEMIEKLNELNL